MRKLVLVSILFSSVVSAQSDYLDNESDDSAADNYGGSSRYESSTGNKYEYDLSRPGDQIRYDVDVRAQLRDEISVNPTREIDRDLGQHGGGIYD